MDKQKEIEKMACDMCLWRHGCNDPNNPINSCISLRMAERAVEAGYGDVKEVQHRAEVAEWALKDRAAYCATYCVMEGMDWFSLTSLVIEARAKELYKSWRRKAEKELAEERKDEI